MAAAAKRAADAQDRLLASIRATDDYLNATMAAADGAAAAENNLADAGTSAAEAAAALAASAAEAANAEREQAASAGTAAAAEDAAAEAAGRLAAANKAAGASAFDAAALERLLAASVTQGIAAQAAMMQESEALRNAQATLAEAAQVAAEGEAKLAEAELAGSLAAYQDAQAAKGLAEADAVLAVAAAEAADATSKANASYAAAIAAMGGYAAVARLTSDATAKAGTGAAAAGRTFRILGTGLAITGNALHWIVAGTAEFLAVAIPAAIALGAAMLVASQGAQNAQQHMQSLYTATEATANQLHVTAGQALGFGDALQRAQNMANHQVYQALGGTLDALGGKFSSFAAGSDQALTRVKSGFSGLTTAGNQVLNVFDGFVAHIQYDLVSGFGGQVQGLLSGMVTDLTEFGQILGNVGHAVLNFASDMPGLAHVLLAIVDAVSQVILAISSLPRWLVMGVMGFEEFYRWGGLVASLLTRLAAVLPAIGPMIMTGLVSTFMTAGKIMSSVVTVGATLTSMLAKGFQVLGQYIPAAGRASTALYGLATAEQKAAQNAALMTGIGIGIIALVALGIALDKDRNSTQQFIDSMNQAIASASNLTVLNTISSGLEQSTGRIQQQEQALAGYPAIARGVGTAIGGWVTSLQAANSGLGGAAQGLINYSVQSNRALGATSGLLGIFGQLFGGATEAASAVDQLNVAQKQWLQEGVNVSQGAAMISRQFGTNFTGSLELAQQAGVKLTTTLAGMSQGAVENRIRIADLVSGYQAMGQNSSAISSDMEVLAVQSGLAATQVQNLTTAMQAYVSNLTGGSGDTAAYVQGLKNMGQVVAELSNNLSDASSIGLSVRQFAKQLALGPATASSAWNNFHQVVGSTLPQLLGWFQTAGAEGMLSGGRMKQGILDALAGVTKFAQYSPTAQSEILGIARANGINVTSWGALQKMLQSSGAKLSGLNPIIAHTEGGMSNLAKVAQNLGNVLSADISKTMDEAKVAASGLYTASFNLAKALQQPHPPAALLHGDLQKLYDIQLKLTGSKSAASSYAQAFADSYGKVGQAAFKAWQDQNRAAQQGTGQLKQTMQSAESWLQQAGQEMGTKTYQGFQSANLAQKLTQTGHMSVQGLADGMTASAGKATAAAQQVTTSVNARTSTLAGLMNVAGRNGTQGLAQGILAGEGAAVAAAQQVAAATAAALAAGLHVKSPSTLTHQYGLWLAQGLANGMHDGMPFVTAAVRAMAGVVAFGRATAAASSAAVGAPAAGAYSPTSLVRAAAGAGQASSGAAGPAVVNVYPQGHVITTQQLGDMVRDIVQTYIPRNPDNGMVRRGRSS